MESHGVIVQRGRMANSPAAAAEVAKSILAANSKAEIILKAQVHAGGRGKGTFSNGFKGGVKVLSKPSEVQETAAKMLGYKLVTKQTGAEGQLCSKVLVNEGITIDKEYYFAILMDRAHGGPVLVASTQGGMDIEEVAEKSPQAIITEPVDIIKGLELAQAKALAVKLGFVGNLVDQAAHQFMSLYKLFVATDATQVREGGGERGFGKWGVCVLFYLCSNFSSPPLPSPPPPPPG
jgi:succinyl-CoA synthetase beta subunit